MNISLLTGWDVKVLGIWCLPSGLFQFINESPRGLQEGKNDFSKKYFFVRIRDLCKVR